MLLSQKYPPSTRLSPLFLKNYFIQKMPCTSVSAGGWVKKFFSLAVAAALISRPSVASSWDASSCFSACSPLGSAEARPCASLPGTGHEPK